MEQKRNRIMKIIRKCAKMIVCVLLILSLTSTEMVPVVLAENQQEEQKIYCNATIADAFDDQSILVVLNNPSSLEYIQTGEPHFPELKLKNMQDLTKDRGQRIKAMVEKREAASLVERVFTTDPNAEEISGYRQILHIELEERGKEKVLEAVSAAWETIQIPGPDEIFWYGEAAENEESALGAERYYNGVQYYGTINGYYVILSPKDTWLNREWGMSIGEYSFRYVDSFMLFAYKNGEAIPLKKVYEKGLLNDEQLGLIYRCYERYREDIYTRKGWEEYEEIKKQESNEKCRITLLVCCAAIVAGFATFCACRKLGKQRTEDFQQCNDK